MQDTTPSSVLLKQCPKNPLVQAAPRNKSTWQWEKKKKSKKKHRQSSGTGIPRLGKTPGISHLCSHLPFSILFQQRYLPKLSLLKPYSFLPISHSTQVCLLPDSQAVLVGFSGAYNVKCCEWLSQRRHGCLLQRPCNLLEETKYKYVEIARK